MGKSSRRKRLCGNELANENVISGSKQKQLEVEAFNKLYVKSKEPKEPREETEEDRRRKRKARTLLAIGGVLASSSGVNNGLDI